MATRESILNEAIAEIDKSLDCCDQCERQGLLTAKFGVRRLLAARPATGGEALDPLLLKLRSARDTKLRLRDECVENYGAACNFCKQRTDDAALIDEAIDALSIRSAGGEAWTPLEANRRLLVELDQHIEEFDKVTETFTIADTLSLLRRVKARLAEALRSVAPAPTPEDKE